MIEDLNGRGRVRAEADVIVVGGGTVGLLTSVKLSESGLRVICLESGARQQDENVHPLNEVVQLNSHYAGASDGRFRCLGGTSTRWGGALIPFQSADIENAGWPINMRDLEPFIPTIEAIFDLAPGQYDLPQLSSRHSHVARLAKWPIFKKRNVFSLFKEKCESLPNLTIWLNATVTKFSSEKSSLASVIARTASGDCIEASAPRFVISAGAIETTRLALLLEQQKNDAEDRSPEALGRYFSDHLSVVVGELVVHDRRELNKHVGFRFEPDGTMRNLRFEMAPDAAARAVAPPSFAHVGFETSGKGGFDALRNMLRRLQKGQTPAMGDLFGVVRSLPWFIRAAWWRYAEKRLLFPDDATFKVHMVIEQRPSPDCRVTLSPTRRDPHGSPIAQIAWQVGTEDADGLTKAVDAFEQMWKTSPLSDHATFKRDSRGKAEAALALGGGIYHPTGSTRMAASSAEGVVDRDLRMFSTPNVRLLSTSVFPTGGGGNPTMMLLLLAARCVDQMSSRKHDTIHEPYEELATGIR